MNYPRRIFCVLGGKRKMSGVELAISTIVGEQFSEEEKKLVAVVDRLDFVDVQILRKFYMTGSDFPNDTQPHCFPILFREMKVAQQIRVGMEAFRKRLDVLVSMGLLVKINSSNPTNYAPVEGRESFVRASITKFFLINGVTKFL